MAAQFGTSGLRGLATELLGEPTRKHVRAFIRHLLETEQVEPGASICIGRDFRDSSPAIMMDTCRAIQVEGLVPIDCGEVPTPALANFAMAQNLASIMITGSHIPADRNGIKFYLPNGEITKADEQAIAQGAVHVPDNSAGATFDVQRKDVLKDFVERYRCITAGRPLLGMHVAVYQHSTVARDVMVEILSAAGAKTTALARSDQFIPVDTEAVSMELQNQLISWAAAEEFDAIVSADGDGDRPLVADEKGNVVRGDILGLLTARFLQAQTVVTPVSSNSGIDKALGFSTVRTRIGSPFVIEGMMQAAQQGMKGIIGFEANGGFLNFSDFALHGEVLRALPTRDSFLPILAALCAVSASDESLSAIVKSFHLPHCASGRLQDFSMASALELINQLSQSQTQLAAFLSAIGEPMNVNHVDGLRITLSNSNIVHLRPSGNAPEFRVYVEAPHESEAQGILAATLAQLEEYKN